MITFSFSSQERCATHPVHLLIAKKFMLTSLQHTCKHIGPPTILRWLVNHVGAVYPPQFTQNSPTITSQVRWIRACFGGQMETYLKLEEGNRPQSFADRRKRLVHTHYTYPRCIQESSHPVMVLLKYGML